jgi:hypothetical protein
MMKHDAALSRGSNPAIIGLLQRYDTPGSSARHPGTGHHGSHAEAHGTYSHAAMTVIRSALGPVLAGGGGRGPGNGPADGMNQGMACRADDCGFGHRQARQAKRPASPSR